MDFTGVTLDCNENNELKFCFDSHCEMLVNVLSDLVEEPLNLAITQRCQQST